MRYLLIKKKEKDMRYLVPFCFFTMNGREENDSNLTARINGAMLASYNTLACLIEYC